MMADLTFEQMEQKLIDNLRMMTFENAAQVFNQSCDYTEGVTDNHHVEVIYRDKLDLPAFVEKEG